jgi:chromosomal replication initiation ATPase DnaA
MQLQFNFSNIHSYIEEDYIISNSNQQAFTMIKSWPNWGEGIYARILYLFGHKSSGKTHLSNIWQHDSKAHILNPNIISLEVLKNYEAFIIEDLENYPVSEDKILHIFNMILEMDKYLLITSGSPPADLKIKLPDLQSRLNAVNLVNIKEADDELLQSLLIKLFAQRQLKINLNVINYIITHSDRSLNYLNNLVREIDKYSISLKKPANIKMIKQILSDQD